MIGRRILVLVTAGFLCGGTGARAADTQSLAGEWRFRLDRNDAGESEKWFAQLLPDRVRLPGDLAEQGIGDRPTAATKWTGGIRDPNWATDPRFVRYTGADDFKFPFWLTPERHYVGAAWYQRDIEIPPDWTVKRVGLLLERPHWETRVWIDGKSFASTNTSNALGTPHEYNLGRLTPGRHVLTIRVDNRMIVDVGENAHSVSDHTQGNWNGIVGRIELRATPLVWIEHLRVHPQFSAKKIALRVKVGNTTGKTVAGTLALKVSDGALGAPIAETRLPVNSSLPVIGFETELACSGPIEPWDEFSPHLYTVTAELTQTESRERDVRSIQCGFRDLGVDGTQFVINGRKTFFRGTLECAIFPPTGHPPTEVASWLHVLRTAKAHGLNMLRFHSWCPPEAAFVAADQLGIYLQVEVSSWPNTSTSSLGDGKPIDEWLFTETLRMIYYYGSHPSFVLLMHGNEPGGKNRNAYLANWVKEFRKGDPRRLYSSGAGWPQLPENQFHVTPDPRVQAWGGGLKSRINAKPPETTTDYREYVAARTVPVISHEIGQWCVYPNFDEIKKYTGYLKPRNFEIFRDLLETHGMGEQAHAFLLASGKLQTLCYKEDIEAALRTRGMGGFQLLDLHDFPGQGTALVGVLDPFWEEKGYVTPREYRRFCNATVPLARLAKRVFTHEEKLEAEIEVAHFGPRPMERVVAEWTLRGDDGVARARGELAPTNLPVDNGTVLGRVTIDLLRVPAPARYKLVVGLRGRSIENDWDVWVYPAPPTMKSELMPIVAELSDAVLADLRRGGKVFLQIPPERVRNAAKDPVALGFSSIFWNTAWTKRQPPTTLGILCDPRHPALAAFPTDMHSNWQWWYPIRHAAPMLLDEFPRELRPTVQVIDDWFTARKLGLVFEARVGRGRLLVCSIDLRGELDPVRRQLRASLLQYVASEKFKPQVEVTAEQVRALMK